jgi:regulator of sigma E protease
MSVILFILILFILVLIHELGHFIIAKFFKIRVDEFGIGYPPRASTLFKRGETTFTLNWLPFGGFVKIFGEDPTALDINGEDKERSFANKPKYAQALVLIAGVFMNFVFAWLLISFGYIVGLPSVANSAPKGGTVESVSLMVLSVEKNSPADIADLKEGDRVEAIIRGESDRITDITPEKLRSIVIENGEREIKFEVKRDNELLTIPVTPKEKDENSLPSIGIAMEMIGILKLGPLHAISYGFQTAISISKEIVVTFFSLIFGAFTGTADVSQITGPIGIVGVVGDAYKIGFAYLISLTALISLNLAVINLIPFPALDGGRLLFVGIEAITKKRIPINIANLLNTLGFGFLILLMLFVTYHDIVKLIKP